jgi:tetratricopeptide (TPR) repeat protein
MKRRDDRIYLILLRLFTAGCALSALTLLFGCTPVGLFGGGMPKEVEDGARLLAAGKDTEAQARFDAYIRQKPTMPETYALVALACSQARRWELQAQYIEKGIAATTKAEPEKRAQLFSIAGDAYLRMSDFQKAAQSNQEALRLIPNNPTFMNNLGYTYAEMTTDPQILQKALQLTTDAVELARKQGYPERELGIFMDSLGWVRFKMGEFDKAASILAQAAEMSPGEPEIHFHLARAYEAKGDMEKAFVQLQRAVQADPQHPQIAQMRKELENIKSKLPPPAPEQNGEEEGAP